MFLHGFISKRNRDSRFLFLASWRRNWLFGTWKSDSLSKTVCNMYVYIYIYRERESQLEMSRIPKIGRQTKGNYPDSRTEKWNFLSCLHRVYKHMFFDVCLWLYLSYWFSYRFSWWSFVFTVLTQLFCNACS